jgi:hypothetical protein
MKYKYSTLLSLTILLVNFNAFSQSESPYETKFKTDGPAVAAGLGLSYLGLTLIKN